jgi:hypothetical protein
MMDRKRNGKSTFRRTLEVVSHMEMVEDRVQLRAYVISFYRSVIQLLYFIRFHILVFRSLLKA